MEELSINGSQANGITINLLVEVMASLDVQSEMLCRLLAGDNEQKFDEFTATYSASVEDLRKEYFRALVQKSQQ